MEANTLFILFYCPLVLLYASRKFDLFSYVFLSSSVYFMPAFFGFSHDGTMPLKLIPLSTELYVFYYFYFLTLAFFTVLADGLPRLRYAGLRPAVASHGIDPDRGKSRRYLRITRFVCAAALGAGILSMGVSFLATEKQAFLDNQSVFISIWQSLAILYVMFAVLQKSRMDLLIAIGYSGLDLYLGFRGVTVFSLAAAMLLLAYQSRLGKFVFLKVVLSLGTVFLALVVYKQTIGFLRTDELETGLERLNSVEEIYQAFLLSESFTQQAIFNEVITQHFSVPAHHAFSFLRLLFPGFGTSLFGPSMGFNAYFQPVLFPEIEWGMASNFWAEQYALFGPVWLAVVIVLFFLLVSVANRKLMKYTSEGSNKKMCFMIFLLVPTLFLIHRNDLEFALYLLRNEALILLFIVVLSEQRFGAYIGHRFPYQQPR